MSTSSFKPSGRMAGPILMFAFGLPLSAAAGQMQLDAAQSAEHGVAFAMQRDLGVMPGQLKQRFDAETQAVAQEASARQRLGAAYAGGWLDTRANGAFKFVVATTQDPGFARYAMHSGKFAAGAPEIEYRQVRHNLRELEQGMGRLNEYSKRPVLRPFRSIASWVVDERSNRVTISILPGGEEEAIDFAAASGIDAAMVRLETVTAMPRLTATGLLGGTRYSVGGGYCSMGFSARRNRSGGYDEYIITAGHCSGNGAIARYGTSNSKIGTFYGSVFPGSDYAVIRVESNDYYTTAGVRDNSGDGKLTIGGQTSQSNGSSVCRSGYKTGWQCGTVLSKGATINYGGAGTVYGLTITSACAGFGDSGGSYVSNISGKWNAQGVLSGGNITSGDRNCGSPSARSYFQPIGEILQDNNVYLVKS
jgi:hypothetical protein